METTWILVADKERARIFARHGRRVALQEIHDMVNPAGRMSDDDLRSDERGRFYGKGERVQGHTADPAVFPVEHETELFVRDIVHLLEQEKTAQRFDHLWIIAAPKILGLLRQKLKHEVQLAVEQDMPKDIATYPPQKIADYINQHSALP